MKKIYLLKHFFALVLLSLIIEPVYLKAQSDECYIYGKITTVDKNNYTGEIRWGKEEAFWSDIFNSTKISNKFIKYLSKTDQNYLENDDNWFSIWSNKFINNEHYISHNHIFACQFGDIKTINITGKESVDLELKNGEIFYLKGGSNDIGTKVRIFDNDIGEMVIKWSRIDKVEFFETPNPLENKYGEPLYGTVETSNGSYTGLVQWDHDERLSCDKLDGDNKDGEVSITFGKIKSIAKDGRGSLVILKTGSEMFLTGSNDVNSENRGIIVTIPDLGRVDIKWRDFRKVIFNSGETPMCSGYNSYEEPNILRGSVIDIDDNSYSGQIIYDLDESWDIELLHGNLDDIEYIIPFRNIKKITPKNYNYSKVELKNGQKLLLGDKQDVTYKNDGILVFGNEDPIFIPWEKVEEIVFK
ncbi:MAG: hypothetical protein K8R58_06340 [Bacteroidales bacterium]|nr:hypothetical protein [Bacteroidales bacterium]